MSDIGFPEWPIFGKEEEANLAAVLERKKWCVSQHQGNADTSFVHRFENEFKAYHEAEHGVGVANGTGAIEVALKALGIGAGDEVIVPPYTFYSTVSAVLQVNATPVFADIDPVSLCIDPAEVEACITPRTRAVIPVHIAGMPCDMPSILKLARAHDLYVVEDSAQGHGAIGCDMDGRPRKVGAIGDIGTFSFQASKNMSAGEGGIILTNSQELHDRCWGLQSLGRRPGGAWYGHFDVGWNYRMPEFIGAVLCAQMQRVEAQTRQRTENAAVLDEILNGVAGLTIGPTDALPYCTRRAYHLYTIRFEDKDRMLEALKKYGIPISPGYTTPQYRQPYLAEKSFDTSVIVDTPDYANLRLAETERACADVAFLPQTVLLAHKDTAAQIGRAIRAAAGK